MNQKLLCNFQTLPIRSISKLPLYSFHMQNLSHFLAAKCVHDTSLLVGQLMCPSLNFQPSNAVFVASDKNIYYQVLMCLVLAYDSTVKSEQPFLSHDKRITLSSPSP